MAVSSALTLKELIMSRAYIYAKLFLVSVALFSLSAVVAIAPPVIVESFPYLLEAVHGSLFVFSLVMAILAVRWLCVAHERRLWARRIATMAPDPNLATYRGVYS
jgi:hypothetical protein